MSRAAVAQRNQAIFRWVVLTLVGLFFVVPLISLFLFTIQTTGLLGVTRWSAWHALAHDGALWTSLKVSVELAVLTVLGMVVLLLPTMVWTRVRVPWARRFVEFICLLPLTIPPIVLVVGYSPVGRWVNYYLTDGPMSLTIPYIVLVLPYAYRAIDSGMSAIDTPTLAEAARSLGASWWTVITRIILPNVRTAVLSAAFLTVALVLGEFTFASLLNYENLQVVILETNQDDSRRAAAAALATLAIGFVLLLLLTLVGRRRKEATA